MNLSICNVTLSPIRAEPADQAEMVTQLLFGETCRVIEHRSPWIRLQCTHDGYEGWADEKQFKPIDQALDSYQMVFDMAGHILGTHRSIPVVLGSRLPGFDGMHFPFTGERFQYTGKVIEPGLHQAKHIKRILSRYMHAPYLWGGRSPFGIDCSGLTQMVYSFLGIALPRDASQQVEHGETLHFVHEAQVGDLAFFINNEEEHIHHVGIVVEDGQIVHASGSVRTDTLDHQGIYRADKKAYTHRLATLKRLI